jgi:D-alanyl-lipoteichoic acid acyltransferase DltB (MBOAT superfamily)
MLFNSLQFLVFFVVVYALYLNMAHRAQNWLLLTASYVFYGAWDYRFLLLLLLSTSVDYLVGLGLGSSREPSVRKRLILCSISFQLGILGFFKYWNFFADSLIQLLASLGLSVTHSTLGIALPIGISFYTFQSMSYTIDVYRERMAPCRRFFDFALFVAFFPQLVAGPIERGRQLIPQIVKSRVVTPRKISDGVSLIAWGLFKKVVIADNLGITVDQIFAKTDDFTNGEAIVGILFFAFQIYTDFSGYTDIARGVSKLMGFELVQNFNLPYFARNPSDFWRRWHISLSSWLRDYLYVSMGGNRSGELKTYRNLLLTMVLGGLWHGAAWNFVCWGTYHGLLLAVHRFFQQSGMLSAGQHSQGWKERAVNVASMSLMFLFTLYGWLLFRANSLEQIVNMTLALPHFASSAFLLRSLLKLAFYAWPLFLMELWQYYSADLRIAMHSPAPVQAIGYTVLFFLFLTLGDFNGASFIYFQF